MPKQDLPLSERTCPVEMSDRKPCGRPVHQQRWADDPDYVCIMHTHDPNKEYGSYSEAFEQELRSICEGRSIHNRTQNKWDFQSFVFFKPNFANWLCGAKKEINFSAATFAKVADFSGSSFDRDVDFKGARFREGATFERTTFEQQARFWSVLFAGQANFGWASFADADFSQAVFQGEAAFGRARFSGSAKFWYVTFDGLTRFSSTTFSREADFRGAIFAHEALFHLTKFSGIANFRWVYFKNSEHAVFHRINEAGPGLRVRFADSLLENVRFEDVNWNRKDRRICLQDEADLGGAPDATEVDNPAAVLTFELVADVYRRLVNNFEKRRQYEWAEECFLGEMEMRRRNPRHFLLGRLAPVKRLHESFSWARWLGENVSLTSLYCGLSKYGSSYTRALGVLIGFIVLFAVLLPAFGLRMPADSRVQAQCPLAVGGSSEAAVISWGCALRHPQLARQVIHTFDAGLWDALEVAVFQKNRTIEPATAGARRLENFETVVIPGQFALLLLAIRRRFRR